MFFSFINLGCTKNLVDTQFLLGRILEKWPEDFYYGVDPFSPEVELVFLNTCGFISSGRNEMFQTMKKLLRKGKKVCLLGCAVQYFEKLTIEAGLNDEETQQRAAFKADPKVLFLSRGALANFEPAMLEKKSSLIKEGSEQSEAEGFTRFLPYNPNLKEKAKELRKNLTKAERKLRFDYLKDCNKKVLKQHPIANYIVDFYIAEQKLVIELDGDTHYTDGAQAYDEKRTQVLKSFGLKVLRFTNEEVYSNFEGVVTRIEESFLNIPPAPLIEGGTANIESSLTKGGAEQSEAEGYLANSITDFSNDQFERPKNSRAYTNIDLGFEYLKIAEGCNNSCAFCIIPKIRGKQVSLSIEDLVKESKNLIAQGVKELILIAQDSTRYGIDRYGKPQLFELLEAIDQIEGDFRYRVLYLYPDILTKKHLERLTKLTKFIPYFDLPLQHASPKILKLMGRFYNHEMTLQLLDFIKSNFEEYYIRTNFIVGFPGETQEDFRLLMDFIEQDWFDNIALFEYHDEPLAPSSQLPDKVDPKIMRERFLQAKKLVNSLYDARESAQKGKEKIGTITDIRTTSKGERAFAVRPILHCPEIDSEDEISMDQILESLDGEDLKVGSEIRYLA